ncbi:MAG: hypothetical protein K1W23_18585 [Lachnospiraceae bacterium]
MEGNGVGCSSLSSISSELTNHSLSTADVDGDGCMEIKGTKIRGGYVRDLHVSDCMTLKSDSACGAGRCNV